MPSLLPSNWVTDVISTVKLINLTSDLPLLLFHIFCLYHCALARHGAPSVIVIVVTIELLSDLKLSVCSSWSVLEIVSIYEVRPHATQSWNEFIQLKLNGFNLEIARSQIEDGRAIEKTMKWKKKRVVESNSPFSVTFFQNLLKFCHIQTFLMWKSVL